MLRLSYGETEALFRLVHDVPEQRARALFARFKAFQQLDFPAREAVGRGSRIGYTLDQILQLLSAFELLQVGAMPQRAARSVSTNWPEQREAYALAWAALTGRIALAESDVLTVNPLALAEMGSDVRSDVPVVDPLQPVSREAMPEWLMSAIDEPPVKTAARRSTFARLVIDPLRIVSALRDYLPNVAAVTPEEVDDALMGVGVEAFGSAAVHGWPRRRSKRF